jgi:pentatricopeptide repeat protein
VVRALVAHGRHAEAVRVLRAMRAGGFTPGLGIYRAVLLGRYGR